MSFPSFSEIPLRSLFLCLSFLLAWMVVTASTTTLRQQTIVEIENVSCNYCLAEVNGILLNLDHTAQLRIIIYPRIFSITHHASLYDDTIVSVLTTAGFPAKVLGLSDIGTPGPVAELPGSAARNTTNRRPCSASAQAWKKLFQRVHHSFFLKNILQLSTQPSKK